MKRTVLVMCIQCAMMTHVTAHARTKKPENVINQMIANEQSLRKQQNELTAQLNELQTYTKAQNKNYDATIESLIAQNDQLIALNQNMMAEIERLNREMVQLQTTTSANKKHILSLTQATTKKVKEIQTFLDNQEAEFNNIINKGKLMALLGLLGLLSALLWAYFLNRKQHKQTQKLKTEVERILNQIQENSDNTMVTWSEQQTDTLNMWQKNFKSEMQDLIQHDIKTATAEHIASIKEAANATIEAENAKVASMAAEKAAQENQTSDSLNLSQFTRTDTDNTQHEQPNAQHLAENSIQDNIVPDNAQYVGQDTEQNTTANQATSEINPKTSPQTGNEATIEDAFASNKTLHQLDSVMAAKHADVSTSGVNMPVADISPADSKEQQNTGVSDSLSSDAVLAELDAVSAELTDTNNVDLPAQSFDTTEIASVDIDSIDIDDLDAALNADDAIDIDEIDALNQLDQLTATQQEAEPGVYDISDDIASNVANVSSNMSNDLTNDDLANIANADVTSLLESSVSDASDYTATDEISLEDMLADDDMFDDILEDTDTFSNTISNQTITKPAFDESDPALALNDDTDNIDNLAQAMQAIDEDDTLVVTQSTHTTEKPAPITGRLAPPQAKKPVATSSEAAHAPVQYDEQKTVQTSENTSKPVMTDNTDTGTSPDPSNLYEQGKQFESQGDLVDALGAYDMLIDTYEFDENAHNMKLVASALDKKAKILLSKNKVRNAIETYDRIISRYDGVHENYAKNMVSEAVLNSTLLELVYTDSIKGSKVGTARTVFKDSPENLLAVEMLEMLRLAVRKDVSTALEPLTLRFEGVSLISMDWHALENWAQRLNSRAKPRVLDTIAFFKGWNESLAV